MSGMGKQLVLISRDKALGAALQHAAASIRDVRAEVINGKVTDAMDDTLLRGASIIMADLDARNHDELVGLQRLMSLLAGTVPVIVLTDSFDDAVGRWFLQIRVSDFLRKPVQANDLLPVCLKTIDSQTGADQTTQIITFTAAQGGVGNTTVAVETAMQLVQASGAQSRGTCLVDLDFQNDACAAYLDVEPRLDLQEVAGQGERLDEHKLDIMTVKHSSGLALLAAPAHSDEQTDLSTETLLRLLDIAATRYSNVIIDMPRTWHHWTDDILRASDKVFVTTDMTVPGLRCARRMVKRMKDRLARDVDPKVIVNRMEKQTLFGGGLRKSDIEKALDGCFAGGIANNYPVVREAIDRGVPLEVVKQGNSVTEDLKRIIFA